MSEPCRPDRVRGLGARGGIDVDLKWRDGKLKEFTIRSRIGGSARPLHGPGVREISAACFPPFSPSHARPWHRKPPLPSASTSKNTAKLTIGVVNPGDSEVTLKIDLAGAKATGAATRWHITGKDRFAHNAPGMPRAVDITRTDGISATLELRVPALANALFVIPLR